MIQIHKSITLTPGHPTNGGMNRYKNFPNGKRVVLSNDNRFTPIATGQDRDYWEPLYALSTSTYNDYEKNGVPGIFGESFNVEEIPTQIITNGVVDMPTNMYFPIPTQETTWEPGAILVLTINTPPAAGWIIGKIDPVVPTTAGTEHKFSNQQIGVLLEKIEWKLVQGNYRPTKPTVSVLVGYSKIPKRLANANTVKAAPLATPKVAAK